MVKYKVAPLGTRNAEQLHMRDSILVSSPLKKDWGVMIDNQLNMSSQYCIVAKRANMTLR